jgi:hypothetical protein
VIVPPPVAPPLVPDDVPIVVPDKTVTRVRGEKAQPILDQLEAFFDEHADQDVVVTWRVKE